MYRLISPAIVILIALPAGLIGTWLTQDGSPAEASASSALQASTSLSVDPCVEANLGDLIEVAVHIEGVEDLLAWELYLRYDRRMLEVVNRDVRQFLSNDPGSSVFDLSDPVPNSTGLYRVAAADVSLSDTAESGAGTLALITFRATSTGLSATGFFREDVNGDGLIDFGPRLTAYGGATVGDDNNDDIFDGALLSGQVAVGQSCSAIAPTPNPDLILPTPATPAPDGTPEPTGATPQPSPGDGVPDPNASPDATGADPNDETEPGASASPTDASSSADGRSNGTQSGSSGGGSLDTWLIGIGVAAIVLLSMAVTMVLFKRTWA